MKKLMTKTLCMAMLMTNVVPVFAATTSEQSTSNEIDSKETKVLYNKSASYFVTIPKTISLGSDKTSLYSVKVDGDIPSDKEVYVSPIDEITSKDGFNFYMKDQNANNPKEDVIADVTQSKFYWNYEDAANAYVETNNNVTALDLSSGTWKGTFDFEINMHSILDEQSVELMSLIYETYPEISEKDAILMTKTEAGLYDDDNNLLYTWDELLDNGWLEQTTLTSCGKPVSINYSDSNGYMGFMRKYTAYICPTFKIINQEALKGRLVIPDEYAGGTDEYVESITVSSYEEAENYNPKYPSTVYIQDINENLTTIIAPKNCTCTTIASADCATGFYCEIWKKPF